MFFKTIVSKNIIKCYFYQVVLNTSVEITISNSQRTRLYECDKFSGDNNSENTSLFDANS